MQLVLALAAAVTLAAIAAPGNAQAVAGPIVVAEPPALAFPHLQIGSFTGRTIRFYNRGDAAAEFGPPSLSHGVDDFTFSALSTCSIAPVAPSGSCSVEVRFRPRSAGTFATTLSMPSNAPGSPHTVSISGTGVVNPFVVLRAEPEQVDFGTIVGGQGNREREIVVSNVGEVPSRPLRSLVIERILPSDSFALDTDSCFGAVLVPGASCRMAARFVRPEQPGTHTATIQISPWLGRSGLLRVPLRAQVPSPARDPLARRLERAARRWAKLPRSRLGRRGFALAGLLQPVVGWSRLELHALLGRGRPVPLAYGTKPVVAATPTKLTAKTNWRGRRLLRSDDLVRLRATLTFGYYGDKRIVVKRDFRLRP